MKTIKYYIAISFVIFASASFADNQQSEKVTNEKAVQTVELSANEQSLFDRDTFNEQMKAMIRNTAKQLANDALSSQRSFIASN